MTDIDLAALFAAPPTEFVATRNAMVKQLRADKRREEATALAAIRRPSWTDWALNAAATDHGDAVSAFADAAAELREAQAASIEGRDGPDLRTALRALREATSAFARHASAALVSADRSPGAGDLAARLSEVAADPATVDQLVAGVLGSSETDGADLFAGLQPPATTSRKRPAAAKAKKPSKGAPKAAADEVDEAAEAEAAAAAQRAELEEALAAAERDREAAATEVSEADDDVAAAERDEAEARQALERAQRAGKEARTRQRIATKALARLDDAVATARAALDP